MAVQPVITRTRSAAPRGRALHGWLLLLALLALVLNTLYYAGVASGPAGDAVMKAASHESPLVLGYLHAGRWLLAVPGTADAARSLGDHAYARVYPLIEERAPAAIDLLEKGAGDPGHGFARTLHWATPALWIAWLLAFQLRQRRVKVVGGR